MSYALRALLAVALALAAAPALADPPNFPIRASNGASPTLGAVLLPDGSIAAKHVNVDPASGLPYGPTFGLPVAPAVTGGAAFHRAGTVSTAGQAVQVMGQNGARRGGYCQASFANTGVVSVATNGLPAQAPNVANDAELRAGQSYSFGYAGVTDQGSVFITSTAAGDFVMCKEIQ